MPKANFYPLQESTSAARQQFACRLTEKACSLGNRVHINTESAQQAKHMDELLWQYKPTAFLPHCLFEAGQDPAEKITIAYGSIEVKSGDVLINLADTIYEFHNRFSHINEIILNDGESLTQGRKDYRFFQNAGYETTSYPQ